MGQGLNEIFLVDLANPCDLIAAFGHSQLAIGREMNIVVGTLVRPTMDFVAGLDVVKPRGAVLRLARAKPDVRRGVVRADFPVVFPIRGKAGWFANPTSGRICPSNRS